MSSPLLMRLKNWTRLHSCPGHLHLRETAAQGKPATAFLFELIARLQALATVFDDDRRASICQMADNVTAHNEESFP